MTATLTGDASAVWAAMRAVYTAVLARDAATADKHLAADVTIWDSDHYDLVRGLPALAELRAARPTDGPQLVGLDAIEPVVDVWGDTALLRHILCVRLAGRPELIIRNTSVWRRRDGSWRAVHNHEDVVGEGAAP